MTAPSCRRSIVICAALGMAAPLFAHAQQSSSTASAAPSSSASDVPNPDVLKKARNAGFHTKVSHNVVLYCKSDTETGTRFTTERCFNEAQLLQHLDYVQAQKDQLVGHTCSGSGCSGK